MILTYVTLLQTHFDSRQTPRQTQHVATILGIINVRVRIFVIIVTTAMTAIITSVS